jgi:hypothetical protein
VSELPPCGVYRTVQKIGEVEAGRLVYFHNHGNPGPGLYFPETWNHNRATWAANGYTLPKIFDVRALKPLPAEGFYRVTSSFHCCEKQCVKFEPDQLLQLGYNGAGQALVFVPEYVGGAIQAPERGTLVDDASLRHLAQLKLPERQLQNDLSLPRGILVH